MLEKMYNILIDGGAFFTILKGLWVTVKISALATLFGTILGGLICWMRVGKIKLFRAIATIYIAILRGSPVLMLLLLMYYVIFAKSTMDAVWVAIATFSLNIAAYFAEVMRSSLSATDKGQYDAARTLGFSKLQSFRLITFPQAKRIAEPVYESTIINLVQWTSVVGYVTITDLTRVINTFSARTMQPLFMIITGMILYLILSYLVSGIFSLIRFTRKRGGECDAR